MDNPLLSIPFEIPFESFRPEQIGPATDTLIERAQRAVDVIASSSGPRTYENTLNALETATEMLERSMTVVDHLESVATSDDWREAYNQARPKVAAFWSALAMNDALYAAVKAFAETEEAKSLPPTRARFVEKTLDDFRRNGAELSKEGKDKLAAIDVELTKLTTRFSQNVLDETNAFELIVTDETKLAGLPESAKAAARQSAVDKGKDGWRFTLQAPSMIPVMTYLDDAEIRRNVWRAYATRATSGERDNRPLILDILRLRREKAELLGYRDFSDLVTEDRMAKSGEKAQAFVDDLRERTQAAFDIENEELQAFRRELEGTEAPALAPWDVGYYAEKLRRERFDFDEEEIRLYFPLDAVMRGLFAVASSLYEIRIVERDAQTWHPDVKTYAIHSDGNMIASFYVDLFPRETKRGGAWMNAFITSVDGRPESPPHVGLFCANVNPAVGDKPALLTHREVETLFHEFGHLLHHCLSKVSVRSLAGTNVAWDFVELPSQIMENWCWERESLDTFAAHYETGEKIPDELFDKMQRARTFRAANVQMRQLGFASVDLALHRAYDPSRDGDLMAYALRILQAHAATALPSDYAMIAGFGHLFASPTAYAAGYYSYKWAEVLDADAFTRFKREGVTSGTVGQAFREAILEKGNSEDPEVLYQNFMGRPPKLDALLERTGLA